MEPSSSLDRCDRFEMAEQVGGFRRKRVTREAIGGQLDLGAPNPKLLEQVPRNGRNFGRRSPPAPDAIELEAEEEEPVAFADQTLGYVQTKKGAELVDQRALEAIPARKSSER